MAEPLEFLTRARGIHGNLFVIRDQGPVFPEQATVPGSLPRLVSSYGAVLSDIETFGGCQYPLRGT